MLILLKVLFDLLVRLATVFSEDLLGRRLESGFEKSLTLLLLVPIELFELLFLELHFFFELLHELF